MRLFVAIYPSTEAVHSLHAAMPPLPPEWRAVPSDQWHVTLAFLGDVADSGVAELDDRLARAAGRSSRFDAALARGGSFGSARRARVLWVGVAGERATLARLTDRVTAAVRRTGIELEDRRFRPHVTLARSRDRFGADATALRAALAEYAGPSWPVGEVHLVHSVLGRHARHETIRTYPLAPGPPAEPYQA